MCAAAKPPPCCLSLLITAGPLLQGGAEPNSYREPPGARRIVPEAVGAGASTAPAAPAPVAGAGAPKPPRRITAEPVGPAPAPSSAAKSSLPAESAVSGKAGAKRITPTPLRATPAQQAVSQQFGAAASQHPVLPAPSEQSRDGHPASGRRITPVPVGAARALPPGEERTATAPAPSGIAALAAAMGAAAAKTRK